MLAPLVVFAYNRPDHLEQTLKSLSLNPEAKDSTLYIFIDGPKNKADIKPVFGVATVAERYAASNLFREVIIKKQEKNQGLAKSVIDGVTKVIAIFGKVIVTEDDSVSSPDYLKFMNGALDYYEKDQRIFSVGGFIAPLNIKDYPYDVVFTQRSSSVAWGTWADRWYKIDWSVSDYKKFRFKLFGRKKFNVWGDDRASMLDDQMNGRINSWAIRFDYAMFKNRMYNVLPVKSLIKNIGNDGSGTHGSTNQNNESVFNISTLYEKPVFEFTDMLISERVREQYIKSYQFPRKTRIKRFIGNLLYKKK